MDRDVRYTVTGRRGMEEKGEGKTVNVSSSGILFTCQHQLAVGRKVKLCISWPVLLNDKVGLKLVVRGRVVRSERVRVPTGRGGSGRDIMVSEQTCRCTLGAEGSGKAGERSRLVNGQVPW